MRVRVVFTAVSMMAAAPVWAQSNAVLLATDHPCRARHVRGFARPGTARPGAAHQGGAAPRPAPDAVTAATSWWSRRAPGRRPGGRPALLRPPPAERPAGATCPRKAASSPSGRPAGSPSPPSTTSTRWRASTTRATTSRPTTTSSRTPNWCCRRVDAALPPPDFTERVQILPGLDGRELFGDGDTVLDCARHRARRDRRRAVRDLSRPQGRQAAGAHRRGDRDRAVGDVGEGVVDDDGRRGEHDGYRRAAPAGAQD